MCFSNISYLKKKMNYSRISIFVIKKAGIPALYVTIVQMK